MNKTRIHKAKSISVSNAISFVTSILIGQHRNKANEKMGFESYSTLRQGVQPSENKVPMGTFNDPIGTFIVPNGNFNVPIGTFIVPMGTFIVPIGTML